MSGPSYRPRQPALEPRWHFVQDVYLPVYEDAPDHPDGESMGVECVQGIWRDHYAAPPSTPAPQVAMPDTNEATR